MEKRKKNVEEFAELSPTKEKLTRIKVPKNISEESRINGFVFSRRFLEATKLKRVKIARAIREGTTAFEYADIAGKIASDSGGGPTVGENSIKIWIDGSHPNAGSTANYIWMYFGRSKRIKLLGLPATHFPAGWWLSWNLNDVSSYLQTIPTDAWDQITLKSDFTNGILINRIRIRHSSVTILDWSQQNWLDNSKLESHGRIGLASQIMEKKLGRINWRWTPQIYYAALELGKTRGNKYGTSGAWCSEFASWCLRKALWGTPTGSIGSSQMENYFSGSGRKYTRNQLLNGDYTLTEGDYLRFEWSNGGHHSGLFIKYIDAAQNPTNNTRFQSIEGNVGSTVNIATRRFSNLISVGNTR